jgi:hypothetical protein
MMLEAALLQARWDHTDELGTHIQVGELENTGETKENHFAW